MAKKNNAQNTAKENASPEKTASKVELQEETKQTESQTEAKTEETTEVTQQQASTEAQTEETSEKLQTVEATMETASLDLQGIPTEDHPEKNLEEVNTGDPQNQPSEEEMDENPKVTQEAKESNTEAISKSEIKSAAILAPGQKALNKISQFLER